ncbi:MAG TPA: ATP-binding protein [Candidatus Saccharimonadales bacterium]|nr:ATP-binding protein [Candidatus Saccharimonadales bacterium]
MDVSSFDLAFPREYLRAALLVSLLSVWVLVGLFCYLNRYTKRPYFTIWTAAWLFYALWLTLSIKYQGVAADSAVFMLRQWCVAISAVFLLWGSLQFLGLPVRQSLFGLFMLFLLVWSYVSPQLVKSQVLLQLPVFILMGLGSIFAGLCFFRLRKRLPFVGAGMLSLGFFLWGLYLSSYPFSQEYENLFSAGFFVAAVLQLFLAVSMIVLVLEEVRFKSEQMMEQVRTIQSEKEALQLKVITTEEQCRHLFDQARMTHGVQQAYDDLRRTQQAVVQQERLRALGQMASGMAHDINNALTPIVAYTDILQSALKDLPEKARRQLEHVRKSAEDIAQIVARMREFYRRRAGDEALTPVDLSAVIHDVIELTRPRWRDLPQRQGVRIQMECQLDEQVGPLLSDATELREAFTNLIFNSVDAMPNGGKITFVTHALPAVEGTPTVAPAPARVVVEIRDTGVGMDERTRQRCLEPFFSTKIQRGGTGLGLAMVYGMMERHDGSIHIESTPGEGTCVRMTFPLRMTSAPTAPAPPETVGMSRPLRVLCIDDEPVIRELLTDSLTIYRHEVVTAEGGRQGLNLFRSAVKNRLPFDVVITDLGMPEVDGRQVASAIKADSPGTPVIMLTGWGTMMKEEGDLPAQVDVVLSKPPRILELCQLLARYGADSRERPAANCY